MSEHLAEGQFPDEDVCFLSEKSYKFNGFGLINRQSRCYWQVTQENINTEFILNFLEKLSFEINRTTFIVLDNARIHKTKDIIERTPYWLLGYALNRCMADMGKGQRIKFSHFNAN